MTPRMRPSPDMLSVEQIAPLLGVSKMTVYRLIHGLELRAYVIGRSYRVRRDDLEAYMRAADTFTDGAP